MTRADAIESHFRAIVAVLDGALRPGERYAATYDGEDTDFVRLNRGKVRQPGHVSQRYLGLRLVQGRRHAENRQSLSGELATDVAAATAALADLRGALADAQDDPLLLLPDAVHSSTVTRGGALPPSADAVERILDAARGTDLVGLYAAGPVFRGFADSHGQRNWHSVTTFNFDWSLHHRGDKAVKAIYAGFEWDDEKLEAKMAEARERLALVAQPSRTLAPGKYRAYLAPSAVDEIAGILGWGAFSARALATQQSPLSRMESGERLDPRVSIREDTAHGVAPAFQSDGFARPAAVALIEGGALAGSLVSPRTSREFGLDANGANGDEAPESFAMDAGDLAGGDVLAALDDGLLIGNLHYLNYSDRNACRITGMTRFATFRVEKGRVVAPVDVLRFDDSVFRLLGSNLEALSAGRELVLSSASYGMRRLESAHVPGLLVREMAFTL
ncbi:MAG TPA: metallopeptidase TldD-related protein [Casimicrobiaceae bacterium]|jgi:predicted Zn-dependent protease